MKKEFFNYKDSAIGYVFSLIGIFLINMLIVEIVSLFGIYGENINSSKWVNYIYLFLVELLYFLITFILSKVNNIDFKKAIKLNKNYNKHFLLLTILLVLVVFLSSLNITNLFTSFFNTSSATLELNSFLDFILCLIFYVIIPSFCEEVFFRGLIFGGLKSKFNIYLSVIFASLIFSLLHLSILQTFYQIVMAIFLIFLVYYTNSLFYSMLFHFINNFIIILLTYIFKDYAILQFTTFGAVQIILSILIFAVGMVIAFFIIKELAKISQNIKNEQNNENLKDFQGNFDINLNNNDNIFSNIIYIFTTMIFLVLWLYNSFGGQI